MGPGQTVRRESKKDDQKILLLFVGMMLGTSTFVQGKGLEGGGQIEGTGNSKSVD